VLRELAQFTGAIRSPVAAVEDQQDAASAQGRKAQSLAILILQNEIRGGLAGGRSDLGRGQTLLRCSRTGHQNNREKQQLAHGSGHFIAKVESRLR